MRRIFCALLCVLFLLGEIPCHALQLNLSAASYVLYDAKSGELLCAHDETTRRAIASTTKVMTALVALETASLSEQVTVRESHMAEGSSMYLTPGETLSMETMLYGLLLASGNDAALAIADHCCGSVEAFVERMNEKAAALGLADTSFANPNGLDAQGHYSTARDMAVLTARAMEHPTFARIVSTSGATVGGRTLTNHNKLLTSVDGCIGGKTGYTSKAGRTLVTCAERGGVRLVAVTLNDGDDWRDHAALYEYGFSRAAHSRRKEVPLRGRARAKTDR